MHVNMSLSLSRFLSVSISLNLCLCACVYRVCVFECVCVCVCVCALPAAPGKPVRKAEDLDALRIRLIIRSFCVCPVINCLNVSYNLRTIAV